MRATDVPMSTSPKISSLLALSRIRRGIDRPLSSLLISPSFLAFRSAQRRVMMRGARAAGTRIANMPSSKPKGQCQFSGIEGTLTAPPPPRMCKNIGRDIGTNERVDNEG